MKATHPVSRIFMLWVLLAQARNSKRDCAVLITADGTFAVRRGKWKFIEKNPEGERRGFTRDQLYDVEKDIGETRNLIAQHPEVVKETRRILDDERKQAKGVNGVPYPRPAKNPTAHPNKGR